MSVSDCYYDCQSPSSSWYLLTNYRSFSVTSQHDVFSLLFAISAPFFWLCFGLHLLLYCGTKWTLHTCPAPWPAAWPFSNTATDSLLCADTELPVSESPKSYCKDCCETRGPLLLPDQYSKTSAASWPLSLSNISWCLASDFSQSPALCFLLSWLFWLFFLKLDIMQC